MRKNFRLIYATGIAALLAAVLFLAGCGGRREFALRPGDLLFQSGADDCSFSEAVVKVTRSWRGAALSHVGLAAFDEDGKIVVLEAIPEEGVTATPLDDFLARRLDSDGNPRVLVGRLRRRYRRLIRPAIAEARTLEGRPYDGLFDIRNDAYYCSELIYVSFLKAGDGRPLFELEPMTFDDPDTGRIFPVWEEYFAELGAEIPEGEPGINPGGISLSPALRIVHDYGRP